jgi:hypothetical protein
MSGSDILIYIIRLKGRSREIYNTSKRNLIRNINFINKIFSIAKQKTEEIIEVSFLIIEQYQRCSLNSTNVGRDI